MTQFASHRDLMPLKLSKTPLNSQVYGCNHQLSQALISGNPNWKYNLFAQSIYSFSCLEKDIINSTQSPTLPKNGYKTIDFISYAYKR